jgi:hypothetical protein
MSGRPLDDVQLIERLAELSRQVAWPTAPGLADRVVAALETAPVPPARLGPVDRLRALFGGPLGVVLPGDRRVARRSLLIAVVAVLAIAVAAAAIGLGVPGIRIEFLPPAPSPSAGQAPGPSASGSAGPASGSPGASPGGATASPVSDATPPGDELGPIVSLDEARQGAGFGLLLPAALQSSGPTEVHLNGVPPFSRVTMLYPGRSTLTEFLGAIQPDAFQKVIGGGTTVDPVRVGSSDGWWIEGAPHHLVLLYRDADGVLRWREVTVTGNVLIWQVGAVTLRFETSFDRAAAIEVGASLR